MTARKGKSKNIALFGHFDSSNFGNASTLQAILYNLKRFHPDAQVACISTGSEARLTTHQVERIPIAETFVKSWVPRNHLMKMLRKVFVGLPSEHTVGLVVFLSSNVQTCSSFQALECLRVLMVF